MAKEILQRLKSQSPVNQRRAAAIFGALLADAATAPLHWIYDQKKVADLIKKWEGHAEFYHEPSCPFYTIPVGNNSTYGDQMYVTLKSIAENKGFDEAKLADAIFKHFGPGTVYEDARKQTKKPIDGPWTNHNIRIFLAKREEGETPAGETGTKDPDGVCKSIIVVALLSGKPEMLETVRKCVETTQLNRVAVGYALGGARILDYCIQHGSLDFKAVLDDLRGDDRRYKYETDEQVAKDIDRVLLSTKAHKEAVQEYGLSCGMPGSFLGMVNGIYNSNTYIGSVRTGIEAAGDNCSRNSFIAACVAAKLGIQESFFPDCEAWLDKYPRAVEVLGYIETILSL